MKRLHLIILAVFAFCLGSLLAGAAQAADLPVQEDQQFTLTGPTSVRFSAGQYWTAKFMPAGTYTCNITTFYDVMPGAAKRCDIVPRDAATRCDPSDRGGTGTKAIHHESLTPNDIWGMAAWYCPVDKTWVVWIAACKGFAGCSTEAYNAFKNSKQVALDALDAHKTAELTDPVLKGVWNKPTYITEIIKARPADKK